MLFKIKKYIIEHRKCLTISANSSSKKVFHISTFLRCIGECKHKSGIICAQNSVNVYIITGL